MDNQLSELQRARKVVVEFIPKGEPGSRLIYAYLGRASFDATTYEAIDGLFLESSRLWHVDEEDLNSIFYIGLGLPNRKDMVFGHDGYPQSSRNRIVLAQGLSKADAELLESSLISELGCILDSSNTKGCLTNIKYGARGKRCCPYSEAWLYKTAKRARVQKRPNERIVLALDADKTILFEGNMASVSRKLGASATALRSCINGIQKGIFSPRLNQPVYICLPEQLPSLVISPMNLSRELGKRIINAVNLQTGETRSGTASQLSSMFRLNYIPPFHKVCRGELAQWLGWDFAYAPPFDTEWFDLKNQNQLAVQQEQFIAFNLDKAVIAEGSITAISQKLGVDRNRLHKYLKNQIHSFWSTKCESIIFYCSLADYPFFNTANHSDNGIKEQGVYESSQRLIQATHIETRSSLKGTKEELARSLGIASYCISRVLSGERSKSNGYVFSFVS